LRRVTIFEDEWRLLVELVDGVQSAEYDLAGLGLATEGLLHVGLVEATTRGLRPTGLGRQIRADAPAYVAGGPRVWVDRYSSASIMSDGETHGDGRSLSTAC
jgi:hypothetical protein